MAGSDRARSRTHVKCPWLAQIAPVADSDRTYGRFRSRPRLIHSDSFNMNRKTKTTISIIFVAVLAQTFRHRLSVSWTSEWGSECPFSPTVRSGLEELLMFCPKQEESCLTSSSSSLSGSRSTSRSQEQRSSRLELGRRDDRDHPCLRISLGARRQKRLRIIQSAMLENRACQK